MIVLQVVGAVRGVLVLRTLRLEASGTNSSLTTSAPISPSSLVQVGPATNWVKSRTRYPSSIRLFAIGQSPRSVARSALTIVKVATVVAHCRPEFSAHRHPQARGPSL